MNTPAPLQAAETQATDALALRDIHLPEPVSWWPPAPGWWLLAGLLIITLAALYIMYTYRQGRRRQQQLQQAAHSELQRIREQFNNNVDTHRLVQSLSVWLRRACISFNPRDKSASLTGEHWLAYLDRDFEQPVFNTDAMRVLATAPYMQKRGRLPVDAEALLDACEQWLSQQAQRVTNNRGEQA